MKIRPHIFFGDDGNYSEGEGYLLESLISRIWYPYTASDAEKIIVPSLPPALRHPSFWRVGLAGLRVPPLPLLRVTAFRATWKNYVILRSAGAKNLSQP